MSRNKTLPLFAALGFTTLATAQIALPILPTLPHARTMDLIVGDTTSPDTIWRMIDRNQDGDYNDAGEVIAYYSDAVGSIALGTPGAVASMPDGTVLVGDLGEDVIIAMRDGNGDGDAHDPGEHRVFFDPSNASGVGLYSLQSIVVDQLGRVFVTNADNGQGGYDGVFLLEDLNFDGDAQDAGEAREYFAVPVLGGGTGVSNPFELCAAPDGNLYFVDNGQGGTITKGIYKLEDLNFDGDCNDAGEYSLFWVPPTVGGFAFFQSLAVDQNGMFYTGEYTADDVVWRAYDLNGNGFIDPGEDAEFFNPPSGFWNDIAVRDDGSIVLAEDDSNDRVIVLTDLNGDLDALDPGEAFEAYDDTISAVAVRPRSLTFMRAPVLTLTPATVQVGNATTMLVQTAKPFDLGAVFLSVGLAPTPISLAPWGFVEIDPSAFEAIGFGLSDSTAFFSLPFGIPNIPTALGTYGVQAWCGDDFRLFLSNGELLTVTP